MSVCDGTIQLVDGRYFNFLRPHAHLYDIEVIAHALSHICRYTGHVRDFYSVAQHSVLVSYIVPHELALWGLMHDAAEAFLGDVSAPLKHLIPEYKAIEIEVERAIWDQFGLFGHMPPEIKHADLVALATEQRDLMPADAPWAVLGGIKPVTYPVFAATSRRSKDMFLRRFAELMNEREE